MSFYFGFRPPEAASTRLISNAQHKRAAAQKGRGAILPSTNLKREILPLP